MDRSEINGLGRFGRFWYTLKSKGWNDNYKLVDGKDIVAVLLSPDESVRIECKKIGLLLYKSWTYMKVHDGDLDMIRWSCIAERLYINE